MPVLKVQTVAAAEKESRRQTIIIIFLSTVCLFGFGYVIYDYIQITDRIALPEELSEVDPAVRQLEADGLVSSFDVAEAKLVVHEQQWSALSHEEKVGMITQLARYCAEKNNSEFWKLTVVGQRTSAKLGELGMMGLTVN